MGTNQNDEDVIDSIFLPKKNRKTAENSLTNTVSDTKAESTTSKKPKVKASLKTALMSMGVNIK